MEPTSPFMQHLTQFSYLLAAGLFILGLKLLSSPKTARRGNIFAAIGMLIAIVVTLAHKEVLNYYHIAAGIIVGSIIGAFSARLVKMTAMPQMVGIFNGLGGGASALVAAAEYIRLTGAEAAIPLDLRITIILATLIGTVTFSGSMIAFGKLQELIEGTPVTYPLQKTSNLIIFLAILVIGVLLVYAPHEYKPLFWALFGICLVLGVTIVLPIGSADMPVVICLLNSYSGLAACAAGFVLTNWVLIISGSLVGASGLILTTIMCKAMNRSLGNVIFGAFGKIEKSTGAAVAGGSATVRSVTAEDAAVMLAYANEVIFVPGYGLAAAQAQHEVRALADLLKEKGVTVKYAIHPVAGRMPGHMNVLLAEAKVPYDELYEMDVINPEFDRCDVSVVIGANDVVNPAARYRKTSPIYGMPILNADHAKNILILKRSLRPGFAGIDNELFYNEKTMMLFGDARKSVGSLVNEVQNA